MSHLFPLGTIAKSCLKILFLLLAVPTALFSMQTTAQNDLVIVPYVEVGYVNYELELDGVFPVPGAPPQQQVTNANFSLTQYKFGLAGALGKAFINGYYKTADNGSDTLTFPVLGNVRYEGERDEISVSVGYRLTDNWTIFAGYRDSESLGDGEFDSNFRFDHDGYFVGGGYSFPFKDRASLTVSAGYADLDASIESRQLGFEVPSASGDGTGVKVGAEWRDFFTKKVGYTVSFEVFDFNYDIANRAAGTDADAEESEYVFSAGLFMAL